MDTQAEFHFFCGKMAAGKSTLALKLSQQKNTILIVEDIWLSKLFPDEIIDIQSYIKYSARLKPIISEHILNLLNIGISVVLDFPANTVNQREWFTKIIHESQAKHTLHYVNTSDDTCLKQLEIRNRNKLAGTAFTSNEEFYEISQYFQEPATSENFIIKTYS